MVEIKDNVITLTRGDTLETSIAISMGSGEPYVPAEGDRIRFALKSKYTDSEPLILQQIPTDTMILRLEADDTKQLSARKKPYVYDVELTTPDGTVTTIIANGSFYVLEEVH